MRDQRSSSFNDLLGVARDSMASGQAVKATVAIIEISARRDEATPVQLVDLLERSCVYGPCTLVDFVWDELGPFAYAGWALALALRCAREDVSRDLLHRGVRLLSDVPQDEKYQAIAHHEVSLSRFDITGGSSNLFLTTRDRTVCSEVFAPFSGREQLLGGSFATMTNIAATCDLVGRLCDEGAFSDAEFADLFRAAVVRAEQLIAAPDAAQPEAKDALLALAGQLLTLHRKRGWGGSYVELVVGNMVKEHIDPSILRLLCMSDSSVFYEALDSFSWLAHNKELVCSLVPCLQPGTQSQNDHLAAVLARGGCLDELKIVTSWPGALSPEGFCQAIEAASSAGHAETAAWLLAQRAKLPENDSADQEDDVSSLLL